MSERDRSVRVQRPQRQQIEWRPLSLDQWLPADHRARIVWQYVESLDLAPLYERIRAVEGGAGRDAVDPRILMALWMLATIEGVGSARQLDRLCQRDVAYMWICGEVGVNYHLLSDFRSGHAELLDQLLSDTVATLMHQGLVTLETVAQDGMRVRANAGAGSFRRRRTLETMHQKTLEEKTLEQKTLEECREEARRQVEDLRQQNEDDPAGSDRRRQAAQKRAARERAERIEQALAELAELEAQKEKRKKGSSAEARCSTTDPQARKMKTADGGCRPCYNVQFATDGAARVIVAVDVTNSGSDRGQMAPLHEDVAARYGKTPGKYLVDGGFATIGDITALEQRQTEVYAPIHGEEAMRQKGRDPHARQRGDTDESFRFRERMAGEEAKTLYKQRPSIAEFPNAECRNRGLQQFRVRGLAKAKAVALWHALTFNLLRMIHLGAIRLEVVPEAAPV
ncbi:MAG: IS1182 family transposase [Planctomycetes bacterium]|nr:IS1182 family transposase [Planctomycetota bacterium]